MFDVASWKTATGKLSGEKYMDEDGWDIEQ